jgi:hypothetical protein
MKPSEHGSNSVQYEGGDVIIKPSWESTDFFLVHWKVFSERSIYFEALLSDRWSKPRMLESSQERASLWMLYIATEVQDQKQAAFVLTTKLCLIIKKPPMAFLSFLC